MKAAILGNPHKKEYDPNAEPPQSLCSHQQHADNQKVLRALSAGMQLKISGCQVQEPMPKNRRKTK